MQDIQTMDVQWVGQHFSYHYHHLKNICKVNHYTHRIRWAHYGVEELAHVLSPFFSQLLREDLWVKECIVTGFEGKTADACRNWA